MSTLEDYDKKKIEYLNAKTKKKAKMQEKAASDKKINHIKKKIQKLDNPAEELQTETSQSNKSKKELKKLRHLKIQLNTETEKNKSLEDDINTIDTEITEIQKNLYSSQRTILQSNSLDALANKDKTEEEIFNVSDTFLTNPDIQNLALIDEELKTPHTLSDKKIVSIFNRLKEKSLDWISACPKWQHIRLMKLYDNYLADSDESKYSDESNVVNAIVSKDSAGFYEYIPTRTIFGEFKKSFTVDKNSTIEIPTNCPQDIQRVIKYKKENYIYVEYTKGVNIKDSSLDKKCGYIKSKNLTLQGSTMDILSTVASSDEFTSQISSTTTKWLSKTRINITETTNTENYSYNLNYAEANFPNPAFLTDKEIYTHFEELKASNQCAEWIDLFLVHKKRMTAIYNAFMKDYSKQVDTSTQSAPAGISHSKDQYDKLSDSKSTTLLATITEKNANVYVKSNQNLTRVGNLKAGDFVKVDIKADLANNQKIVFDFLNYKNKKYIPIICLSDGKVLYGYVNSDFISFLTTDQASVIEKADYTQTINNASTEDALNIKILEDTVRSQTVQSNPNIKKNPTFMSDKEIFDNINALNDFEKIYSWAKSFPLQTKRIKRIYDKINEPANPITNGDTTTTPVKVFDDTKPKTLMATVIRDKAHVYPCSNNSMTGITAANNKVKSDGILNKGAKIKVALNDSYDSASNASPVFVYHKDSKGENTHYLKIQYLDSNYLYKEGFISVNAISTYTVEQEIDDILSKILSNEDNGPNIDDAYTSYNNSNDDLDFSLTGSTSLDDYINMSNDTFLSSVGDAELEFTTVQRPDGTEYKNSDNETVDFDLSIATDKNGKPIFDENGDPVTQESKFNGHNFNRTAYDITTSSFGTASSLVGLVMAIKGYSETFDVQDAINAEFLDVMSSTNGFVSSTLGLAKSSISETNSNAKNLEAAGKIFDILSTTCDTLKMLREKVPEYWESIKKREPKDAEEYVNDFMELLDTTNGILGLLSDYSSKIPIVSAYISAVNSAIQLILDIVKFISDEIQIWNMFNTKAALKSEYSITEDKKAREIELEDLNKKIDKLQFKGSRRITNTQDPSKDENNQLQELLSKKSKYMDLFITTELETVNKKRRNRKIIKLTQDVLNLATDILGVVSITIPEPNTIVAVALGKIGVKSASSAVGVGSSAVRNIKQWYRDKDPNNPNNTRNKKIKYAKITAGILNNIIRLKTTTTGDPAALEKRYTLVESHIRASGASIDELQACNGDVGQMFRIIFAALQKRE